MERWNDQAITVAFDDHGRRLHEVEDQVEALRLLPERMADLRATCEASHETTKSLRADVLRGDDREDRRVKGLHDRLDQLDRKLDERFDRVDGAHAAAAGIDWRTVLAVVTGVAVPLAVAIIVSGGGP